jgi:hypothetical protein
MSRLGWIIVAFLWIAVTIALILSSGCTTSQPC